MIEPAQARVSTPDHSSSRDSGFNFLTIFTWLCLIGNAIFLYRITTTFSDMYSSMNAPLPGLTEFVVHQYQWFYPILFAALAGLLIAIQLYTRRHRTNLPPLIIIYALLAFIDGGTIWALYAPLWAIGR